MEEHELVGAQEWLLDGDEPSPKLSRISSRRNDPPEGVTLADLKDPAGGQQISRPRVQSGFQFPKNSISAASLNRPSPVQTGIKAPIVNRNIHAQNEPAPAGGIAPPSLANRTRAVWVKQKGAPGTPSQRNRCTAQPEDTPAQAAWRAGLPHTGRIDLPFQYRQLRQKIMSHNKLRVPEEVEKVLFEQVMAETGAFIPPPPNSDQHIRVWGTSDQVRKARLLISRALAVFKPPEAQAKKKSAQFVKIQSYSEQKEEMINKVEKHESVLQLLRQKPDPSARFPETLAFLWPADELPIESSLGPRLEALDPLRVELGCPIYVDDELPSYIRVDAYDHDTILKIVSRLRAEWIKLLATIHVKIKLYLVQPPKDFTDCEVQVKMPRSANGAVLSTPVLYGTPLGPNAVQSQGDKRELIRMKNESRLRDAVEHSLRGLRFLRGHVRMRVNFGLFVLDDYRIPQGKPRYSYEEFRSMLFHSRTKGHLIPGLDFKHGDQDILTRIAAATNLLSPYEVTSLSLEDAKPLYAVNFEFAGEDGSILRLEAEFAKSPASGLFEVFQRRWIRPQEEGRFGDRRPPLHIGVIDFESSDWQLEICAVDFQAPSSIAQALRAFSHSIQFKPGADLDLRENTTRKVTFSNAVPVSRLVEKTALRYRLKGTSYILEVARYDEYFRAMPGTNELTEHPVVSWGASIFDLQWDNVLGQHANFRLGHTADWVPSLSTFFPDINTPDPSSACTGFDQFMELLKRVSVVLCPGPKSGTVVPMNLASNQRTASSSTLAIGTTARPGNSSKGKSWAHIAK
ncbi:hypothetical protein CIRG_03765 [Coccidioides immitis RMSCC 2394]|uniref:DUF7905 domain-containing protein n=1 Tax=Coccidioides immitis RMSCC 2394 TaxID=404692 RepID=A0A0J6YAN3_COCIT|nr:hypothetical protein CIRG_03765 [Coccidioides immitis RMSCC 2394]